MHAHRLNVTVLPDRRIAVLLPDDFPPGPAEIIVLAERGAPAEPKGARPVGLAAGQVVIHPSFFEPLPSEMLEAFEGEVDVKLLADTCAFLWMAAEPGQLSTRAREALVDREHTVYLSAVSVVEICIKHALGQLSLPSSPAVWIPEMRLRHELDTLALDEVASLRMATLPSVHRDPFDRMLICQALAHDLTVVTSDAVFPKYGVKTLW